MVGFVYDIVGEPALTVLLLLEIVGFAGRIGGFLLSYSFMRHHKDIYQSLTLCV